MSPMIGDDRKAAGQIAMEMNMADLERPGFLPTGYTRKTATGMETLQLVQWIPRAFVFGHYDSRGGSSLIEAVNLGEAAKVYNSQFGMDTEELGLDPAGDDYIGRYGVAVYGECLPKEGGEI